MEMRIRHAALVLLLAATSLGCSGKRAKAAAASETEPARPEQAAIVPAVAPKAEAAPVETTTGRKPLLHLSLRSTPSGAVAAVDGRQVGTTPVLFETEADGHVHEFTFVLAGYSMERYKFPPVKDGVIHATLRPIPAPDAGTP